jgi:hypothetical protein
MVGDLGGGMIWKNTVFSAAVLSCAPAFSLSVEDLRCIGGSPGKPSETSDARWS